MSQAVQNMESNEIKVRKGAWTKEEDLLLTKCIQDFGEGKWHLVPHRAGLNRCRKSCRMRWLNYLQPNVKRGYFDPAEVDLIQRLHKLLGNRWSLIAGRIPGRTANDVKNFWNTHISKKNPSSKKTTTTVVIKPRPRHLTALASKSQPPQSNDSPPSSSSSPVLLQEEEERDRGCDRERDLEHERWWREVLRMSENGEGVSFEDLLNVGPPEYDGGERVDVDGLMSDLLVDFHAWENI